MSNIPSSAEVIAGLTPGHGMNTVIDEKNVGRTKALLVALERHDFLEEDGTPAAPEYEVCWVKRYCDDTTIHPEDVPAMIAALEELHARWLIATHENR